MTPQHALNVLRGSGCTIDSGLSEEELRSVEKTFKFYFSEEHRALLTLGLPQGASWPNWRDGEYAELKAMLDWPVASVLHDVEESDFWHPQWGERPRTQAERVRVAREALQAIPRMVPIYAKLYCAGRDVTSPNPVFSIMHSDVMYLGASINDWISRALDAASRPRPLDIDGPWVDFWSDLAEGVVPRGLDAEGWDD